MATCHGPFVFAGAPLHAEPLSIAAAVSEVVEANPEFTGYPVSITDIISLATYTRFRFCPVDSSNIPASMSLLMFS